jgi:adenylate kinase family enzyme
MKLVVYGNSGSGKSTLSRALATRHGLAHLDLDSIVWEPGRIAVARPIAAVRADLDAFVETHARWVIEGCYGEFVSTAAAHADELVFLNPGIEACLAHNRRRAWEPHKYASRTGQDSMLEALQAWAAAYATREDAWSLRAHRALFDAHDGRKVELTDAALAAFAARWDAHDDVARMTGMVAVA